MEPTRTSLVGLSGRLSSWVNVVWGAVALAALTTGCGEPREKTPPAGEVRTVVLLSIDTWRYDATGFLGNRQPTPTPFIDSLARRGLVALNAFAPVPMTAPSHWSMLTGRWPWKDGVRLNGDMPATDSAAQGLAPTLRDRGWRTAAFVSASVLYRRFGFGEGFDHYDDRFHTPGGAGLEAIAERRGDRTVDTALAWLGKVDRSDRVFVWVHLFDPHTPYSAPRAAFEGEHGDYLSEVAFADSQVKRLADGLASMGRPIDDSLWVVLSDHGEGLGEHGEGTHGLILHSATTRIPMLVAGGPVEAGRWTSLAATVDVHPTILEALGIPAPESDGKVLGRVGGDGPRAIPLESMYAADAFGLSPVFGLRRENWLWESSPLDRLWDVVEDPAELNDLASARPRVVESLRSTRESLGMLEFEGSAARDDETLSMLESLGYLASGAEPGEQEVREFVLTGFPRYDQVMNLLNERRFAEAETVAAAFLEDYPLSSELWMRAGMIAVNLEQFDRAEFCLQKAVELKADSVQARVNLGNVLLELGNRETSNEQFLKVLELDPENMFALYNLGADAWRLGKKAEAAEYWGQFVSLYPAHPRAAQLRQAIGR